MKNNINANEWGYRGSLLLVIFSLFLFRLAYAQDVGGVLVAAESSPIQNASIIEIRRIYLGLPPSRNSLIKKPVINLSDQETFKAFLKNIMHMTERGYQRKLIKRIFRQGGGKIIEVEDNDDLVGYLVKNPHDVSFMDRDVAERAKGIKVVQVLW